MSKRRKTPRLHCPAKYECLRQRCLAPIEAFYDEGHVTNTPDGPYIFQDNGANVLAVAHLDTVRHDRHFGIFRDDPDTMFSCQLDDRLGAWIALDVLPQRGIAVDVLLTTGEECCRSTAKHFLASKQYNWLVEFDRAGSDVVTYQYEGDEWLAALEMAGNTIGWGSYSDIAELGHLEVEAVNWGVGYRDNHSFEASCSLSAMRHAVGRFAEFYAAYHGHRFESPPCLDDEYWQDDSATDWRDTASDVDWMREEEAEWREYYRQIGEH